MTGRPPPLLHLLLALLVSWPMARDPRGSLIGHPDVDVWNHAWGAWWWWESLSQGTLPWRTTLLRAPDGGVLWFIDPLLAALSAPLVPLIGVAGAWNAGLLASLVFTSWSGAALARALGEEGRPVSALGQSVASGSLVCSAAVVAALHNGISEALHLGPLALGLAAGERTIRSPEPRRALLAGAGAGLVALVSPYLGLGLGLALGVRALGALLSGRRGRDRLLRALLCWALGALVLGAIGVLPLAAQLDAADAIVRRPEGMDESLALHNAVDPRGLLLPLSVTVRADEGFASGAWLGLLALGLALLRPRPAWLVAALVCGVTALGPWLSWGGAWVELGGARIPLPWRALQALLPFGLTHPSRLLLVTLTVVAGLAGAGADRVLLALGGMRAAGVALVPLVALDGLLLSGAPWPIATSPAEIPAVYGELERLADQDARSVVLDLPTDAGATMATSRYLYWQTAHGRPIPYAPDARASTSALIDDPFFRALASLATRRADEQRATGLDHAPQGDARPERLRDRGVRWIVLHSALDPSRADAVQRLLEASLGPGRPIEGALLWDLETQPRP